MIKDIHFEPLTTGMKARFDPAYRRSLRGQPVSNGTPGAGRPVKKEARAVFPFRRLRY